MTSPVAIVARSRFCLPSQSEGFRWHQRRPWWVRASQLTLIGLLALLTAWAIWRGNGFSKAGYLLAFVALSACVAPFNAWLFARRMRRNPSLDCDVFWRFDGLGFSQMGDGSITKVAWERCEECVITPAGLLLYPEKDLFYWVPRDAFATPEEYERVLMIMKEKAKCWEKR